MPQNGMQNGARVLRERPKRGDKVRNLQGELFKILEPGMKYALVSPMAGGANVMYNYRDIFPVTNERPDEGINDIDN